jgi:hypothetical protein
MDSMDNVRERIEALEQQMKVMGAHTRIVERRLRWWRGIACGLLIVGLVSVVLPSGNTVDAQQGGLPARVAALEDKLVAVTFDSATKELAITGANLRIVNGLGSTETTNGLGNLIVGYNELRSGSSVCSQVRPCIDTRTGSHNVVVGPFHNFSSFGGLVVGWFNEISGDFASVSGGALNLASESFASVSGGEFNTASGLWSWVSGGNTNKASESFASVSGGGQNLASGQLSAICGGAANTASAFFATVSGGTRNTASGDDSSVSGGDGNTARGERSSVSGGNGIVQNADFGWAAGSFGGTISGRFVSP